MYNAPYGDTQQLNLDWFIKRWKEFYAQWEAAEAGIDGALDAEIQRVEDAMTDLYAARDAAAASATAAATSASSASNDATTATNAATAAAASATLANNKAAAAGLSEANAAQSATNAGNSASAAATSASQANASAASATASEQSATASATAAAGSASAAATSETNAAASAQEAEDVLDSIPADYSDLSNDVSQLINKTNTNENWFFEYGTYNKTTGAQNGTPNAVRCVGVPYTLPNTKIELTSSAISDGYKIRVLVMETVDAIGADKILESFESITSAITTKKGFLRIALLKSNIGTQLNNGGITQEQLKALFNVEIVVDSNFLNRPWKEKKANAIGDSIVKGDYGNFVQPLQSYLGLATARIYGIGGSCIASSSRDAQYPPVVTRYVNMDNDAELIIVHAGTNDYSTDVPIGNVNSTDITTFNGALNVLMAGLRSKYPTALIVYSQILDRQIDGANGNGNTCQEFRDALTNACKRNHEILYDGYNELAFNFKDVNNPFRYDSVHLNQAGANALGRSMAGFCNWH